jgi:hypothetical protein
MPTGARFSLRGSLPRIERQLEVGATILIVAAGCGVLYADWSYGRSVYTGFASLIPTWDSHFYYRCANYLLDHGNFGPVPVSDECNWRPIYSSLFATLTAISGRELHLSLMLQTVLVSLGIAALFRELLRWLGIVGALAALAPLWVYATRYGFPNIMTENAGLMFGATALALLVRGAGSGTPWLSFAGMVVLTTALNARAGCYFVLPALVAWAAVYGRLPGRGIAATLLAAALAIAAGFVFNAVIVALIDIPLSNSNSNFAFTLYGLAVGGKGWIQAKIDHPGADRMQVYHLAIAAMLRDPLVITRVLLGAFVDCFRSGAGLAGGYVRHLGLLFWCLWLVGFAAIVVHRRDPRYTLLGAFTVGSLLSGPLIFQDGEPRAFAATIAADATQMGLGVALLAQLALPRLAPRRSDPDDKARVPWPTLTFAALLMTLVLVPYTPLRRLAALPAVNAPACPAGETTLVSRLGRETLAFTVLPPGGTARAYPPRAFESVAEFDDRLQAPYSILLSYQRYAGAEEPGAQYGLLWPGDVAPLLGKTVRVCFRREQPITSGALQNVFYIARSIAPVGQGD